MLTDIKIWLENTEMKVAEERFLNPPVPPYIVFIEESTVSGADNKNCIANRSIGVEMYSAKINHEAEGKIETLLNEKSINYTKDRTWVETEMLFQTVYDFELIEKF